MKKKLKRVYRISKYVIYRETLVDPTEVFWSFVGSFVGIGLIGLGQVYFPGTDKMLLIGSFGASSVLIFGAIQSPMSQPRNLIGGHVISAIIGVVVCQIIGPGHWLAAALSVALSIVGMQVTKTLHPPGGATALIAVIGSERITSLGLLYVLYPVLTGVATLFCCALIFNNLTTNRRYPSNERYSSLIRRRLIAVNGRKRQHHK